MNMDRVSKNHCASQGEGDHEGKRERLEDNKEKRKEKREGIVVVSRKAVVSVEVSSD